MNALGLSKQGFKIGFGMLGTHGAQIGSVRQIVHDGDTVNIRLTDNLGVRFLGIDTAEVSYPLPGGSFVSLKNERWSDFFTSGDWRVNLNLHEGLMLHLEVRIGDGTDLAANHARQADRGQRALEASIQEDMDKSGKSNDEFGFFMAFGHEFLDGTGRLLCYLHPGKDNFKDAQLRKTLPAISYNERQLASGAALPYFIWPNIQPFLIGRPFSPENLAPDAFWKTVQRSSKLAKARRNVQDARRAGLGVFDPQDPLRLEPFELRYISRGKAPSRYVIDLSQPGLNRLLAPELYYTIPNPEDRLYIPEEYRLLFEAVGWNAEITAAALAVG